MAHLLDKTTGRNAIAYVGEVPWHGLGQQLTPDAPLETWQIEAGLDWEAREAPVRFNRETIGLDGQPQQTMELWKQRKVLYRSDTGTPLSVVSDGYRPVQPKQVIEFYRELTEKMGFKMETAGAIKGGTRVWALARVDQQTRIRGNDVVNGYLLLATSYDGTMATTARATTIRVVCNNTLTAAYEGKADVVVRHSSTFDADEVRKALQIEHKFVKFFDEAQQLAEVKVDTPTIAAVLMDVYFGTKNEDQRRKFAENEDNHKRFEKLVKRVGDIFQRAPGATLPSARDSAWGLLNAITYDIDHAYPARSQENRLNSAWFGQGEGIKNRALERVSQLLAA